MTSSLGLTTKKALAILRDQLTTLLEGHQKERKKVTSWKVRHQTALGWMLIFPFSKQSQGLTESWLHFLFDCCCKVSKFRTAKVFGNKARNYLGVYFSVLFLWLLMFSRSLASTRKDVTSSRATSGSVYRRAISSGEKEKWNSAVSPVLRVYLVHTLSTKC